MNATQNPVQILSVHLTSRHTDEVAKINLVYRQTWEQKLNVLSSILANIIRPIQARTNAHSSYAFDGKDVSKHLCYH
jgi:hypothetical protein